MNRQRLEMLAEAIAHVSGYAPGNPLYAARNPLGLRPSSEKHARDEHGNRVFRSVLDGWQAAIFDLDIKINGRLSPDSTLLDLAMAYHQKMAAKTWARFLKQALADDSISPNTVLKQLLEKENTNG
jgi:hypothetical protein